jgi:hypothetical protein
MRAWRTLSVAIAMLACVEARPDPKAAARATEAGASKTFYIYGYGSLLHEGSRIRVSSFISTHIRFSSDAMDAMLPS